MNHHPSFERLILIAGFTAFAGMFMYILCKDVFGYVLHPGRVIDWETIIKQLLFCLGVMVICTAGIFEQRE